jgi:hypothetical protein
MIYTNASMYGLYFLFKNEKYSETIPNAIQTGKPCYKIYGYKVKVKLSLCLTN